MLLRPRGTPEVIWTSLGALALVVFGLLPVVDALGAVREGIDVYLFLAGMMLLAELARACGLFDWLAALATNAARGSPARLFTIVYALCVGVTVFFSNDATAVVLTPAVATIAARARVDPLPALFACAFVANAASFVLPISNPANLVIYGNHLPALVPWFGWFALPSLASILATYIVLRLVSRQHLRGKVDAVEEQILSPAGRRVRVAIGLAALGLVIASLRGAPIGIATILCAAFVFAVVTLSDRQRAYEAIRGVDASVLLLVAGLFVIVAALDREGALRAGQALYATVVHEGATIGKFFIGTGLTLACNVMNNLPVALGARYALAALQFPGIDVRATTVAVDLGPNLSLAGSLATLLWMTALRRAGIEMNALRFSRVGVIVTLPALALALALIR